KLKGDYFAAVDECLILAGSALGDVNGTCRHVESVAVPMQNRELGRHSIKKRELFCLFRELHRKPANFLLMTSIDASAQNVSDQLSAQADSQDRFVGA